MSSPSAPTVPETIRPTNRARDSPLITPLHDDPYMLTDETQLLSPRAAPLSPDYTLAPSDYTPDTPHTDGESEPMKASKTRTTSPSDSTSPLFPDHPLTQTSPTPTPSRDFYYRSTTRMAVRTQPTLLPGYSAKLIEAMTLSPLSFRKRYRSSYEASSSSASPASSLTLPIWKRYRGTSELILDTKTKGDESEAKGTDLESEESEDEGPSSGSKEAASENQQQQATPVEDIAADEPLGLGYRAARRCALEFAEGPVPSTFEVRHSSRFVADQQRADETPMPRLPTRPTWVNPKDDIVYLDIEFDPPAHAPVQTPASPE
ncbi:hypothetical protein Tco_0321122 [Tanacetum coccineum]